MLDNGAFKAVDRDSFDFSEELRGVCSEVFAEKLFNRFVEQVQFTYCSVQAIAQEFVGFLSENSFYLEDRTAEIREILSPYIVDVADSYNQLQITLKKVASDLRDQAQIIGSVNLSNVLSRAGQIEHAFGLLVEAESKRWLLEDRSGSLGGYKFALKILEGVLGTDHALVGKVRKELRGVVNAEQREVLVGSESSNLFRLLW